MEANQEAAVVEEVCVCAFCKGPWHPASGMLVGTPSSFPLCSRCWRESMAVMKWAVCRKGKGKWRDLVFYPEVPAAKTF